ncbi:Cro/CI family transcriptional regulator [[Clostridium] innocuum]|nr:Cro/CI family transcriptional regulator [[Clostridium] innocuum]MCI3002205.1 Cro/CI family transcriptional regulator [[Clostridium] innocuum]MCR0177990.1 Cro/CI family transcriptional regulator [[Clostridium] innocuum]MCR0208280.1 Cro/CI family transcriptional regulator [[Clostridium] innocuum]MCR0241843.1 Cro/CI family transcriptional regulator [[Clostridium] innocuum]MCR0253993.1 Cro/CI family transcriptional regulator [[Clostridium] innocuum]
MKRLNLADYPQKQLEDFTRYVFGVHYTSIAETLQKGRENL